jgi:hypothetical protein
VFLKLDERQKQILYSAYPTFKKRTRGPKRAPFRMTVLFSLNIYVVTIFRYGLAVGVVAVDDELGIGAAA